MVELQPAPFADLVERMFLEYESQAAIFDLPRRKWYVPQTTAHDLSVLFHGHRAGTPVGPASGPHTQMAQNVVLCWLAGARIIEFKTVQINDRLTIPRPCIDAANVCYNVEWSQELRIADSIREYVAGAMLVHMLRRSTLFGEHDLGGPSGDVLYDISIGYDLEGIRSRPMREFMSAMKDATATIDALRLQIPAGRGHLRDLDYPTRISSGVTLSTFHGCPAEEIERICEFLLSEMGMDVVVKMNPPMLGRERLEYLLHEVLGYDEITVNPAAYASGIGFDEAVAMCRRLADLARVRGRGFGAKFSNTLEALNHRNVFTPDNKVMYLSGQPLHVITLTLADLFRGAIGPDLPFTFSAGVDRYNFADMVACGFCPVTTCTDLLRPGGYGRLPAYLAELSGRMSRIGSRSIGDFILDSHSQRSASGGNVRSAAAANLAVITEEARRQERYRAPANRTVAKRMGTHLALFDCVSCDKCIPVCPNDANFSYVLPVQQVSFCNWLFKTDSTLEPGPPDTIEIEREHQIANFGDFCNECGNCDTFCPEHGGPFIEKPTFFGTLEGLRLHPSRDGFHITVAAGLQTIRGRIKGRDYLLQRDSQRNVWLFDDGTVRVEFDGLSDADSWAPDVPRLLSPAPAGHTIEMRVAHTLRLLLLGLTSGDRIHQVNTGVLRLRQI